MEERAYPRPFADLRTLPAAVRHLDAAFAAQQERAVAENAEPNASVAGDARVRLGYVLCDVVAKFLPASIYVSLAVDP